MSKYTTEALRSVALVGHGAAGKTSLAEALLFATNAIAARAALKRQYRGRFRCPGKGSWPLPDFRRDEFRLRGHPCSSDRHPGLSRFAGQAIAALAGVDTALIVINAQTGVELMTERMMRHAAERKLCRMIVINKIDADNLDLPGLVADIRERFGKQCMLLDLPAHGADVVEVLEHDSGDADFESVAAAHRALIDQIVEEDEDLLAQYLEDGADPSATALHAPFEKRCAKAT